jgi:hypothetical protein
MSALWLLEGTTSRRFPYRIAIEQAGRLVVAFRVQARWPGSGQQVFCLREETLEPDEALEELERVPILQLERVGRKLTVVLDRGTRKRCEFLTVRREKKDGSGSYEQVFFRTESGIRAHRSRTRVELRPEPVALDVVVDSTERYPWRFPGATITRRKLPVGDYALLDGGRTLAVVERKSFANLLSDLSQLQALHHQLADLAGLERSALVIEAHYRDFLDPRRLEGRWPKAKLSRRLAELSSLHPRLPVIYAGSRKLANLWTYRFFQAVARARKAPSPELELDLQRRYDPPEARAPGIDEELRRSALERLPASFTTRELLASVPGASVERARRVLAQLHAAGRLARTGRGSGTRWERPTAAAKAGVQLTAPLE